MRTVPRSMQAGRVRGGVGGLAIGENPKDLQPARRIGAEYSARAATDTSSPGDRSSAATRSDIGNGHATALPGRITAATTPRLRIPGRGGSWNNEPRNLRSANRNRNTAGERNDNNGFRIARTLDGPSRRPHGAAGRATERPGAVMTSEGPVPLLPHPGGGEAPAFASAQYDHAHSVESDHRGVRFDAAVRHPSWKYDFRRPPSWDRSDRAALYRSPPPNLPDRSGECLHTPCPKSIGRPLLSALPSLPCDPTPPTRTSGEPRIEGESAVRGRGLPGG